MILLQFGANTTYFTLTEKTTLANAKYVFVFVNDNTGRKVACTAPDLSTYTAHHNQFTLTVVASGAVAASGQIQLDDYGFYHYYVYETLDPSTFDYTNIDTTDLRTLTGEVEIGKMQYLPSAPTYKTYKDIRTSIKTYGT